MAGKTKITLKQVSKHRMARVYRKLGDTAYKKDVEALSYKQLLRISSAVNATSEREKAASKLFYHSLTPPEIHVAKAIQQAPNAEHRLYRLNVLQQCLRKKNEAEILDVNIDAILHDAKTDPLL